MPSFAFRSTKWTLDIATKLIQADVRLHNSEAIQDDLAILFVVNHFTRIETLLLPYVFYKHTGKIVWSLAASDLFRGKIGDYLRSTGNLSTKDPDRDKIIVRSLLAGENPWIIFPEGAMIKDKKVVDHEGMFRVYNHGARRPPHRGAAVLALRAEFYRHKLECLRDNPKQQDNLEAVLRHFGLPSIEQVLKKRTVVIPVNITYYPMRAHDNLLLRAARHFAKNLSNRAIEELSVEGTILSEDSNIDITLGAPIEVRDYLNTPEYTPLMACGDEDLRALEDDPRSLFNEAARRMTIRFMSDIYRLTTVNYDHIFATLIRHRGAARFTERTFRNRVFLAAHYIKDLGYYQFHTLLARTYRDIIYEDPSPKFDDFIQLCLKEGILQQEGPYYRKTLGVTQGVSDFHEIRQHELTYVIANEIEPLTLLTGMLKQVAGMKRPELSRTIRDIFVQEDQARFEEDYAKYYKEGESKDKEVGCPFLLQPKRPKAGIVLVHGYLAAPMEVRGMAEFFVRHGYAVYGVRLKGHGTTPEDLAQSSWEDWYESMNRGYAVIKSLTDNIILGGFSTGGGLALLGAARKRANIRAVFSINAPLQLRRYAARWAPSLAAVNSWLGKALKGGSPWEFVENHPENDHINYLRNPLQGVRELAKMMEMVNSSAKDICAPTYILQGSHDNIVNAASGERLYAQVGSAQKELTVLERIRHGIINGEGADDVYEHVHHFLLSALGKKHRL